MTNNTITGKLFYEMINGGAEFLSANAEEVNDLNVFPIPDGDTGDNMSMTMRGGANVQVDDNDNLSDSAAKIARGMLMGARGNSGVILSQFFAGISNGFKGIDKADIKQLANAFQKGVEKAYSSVVTPTEGTILTVIKDASAYAGASDAETVEGYLEKFIEEAERSLERTPDLLACLKEAGVVDSGGAGLIYVIKGMLRTLTGDIQSTTKNVPSAAAHNIDPDLFTSDTILEFGYCTELLIRLQSSKTDVASFNTDVIVDYLSTIGNSIVAFKTDSIVKLHVHTMTPGKVLDFCQQFGEFLTIKIENMMLQHSEVVKKEQEALASEQVKERSKYAVITVANGDGLIETFKNLGADEVISGGQTMNPSAEDFVNVFDKVNADTIFVLPNNGNIILAAKQAAELYNKSDIRIIPTRTIGDGYSVLTMLDLSSEDADEIESEMNDAMCGVKTAEISKSIRNAEMNELVIEKNDYVGIIGKYILTADKNRVNATCAITEKLDIQAGTIVVIVAGKDSCEEDTDAIKSYIEKTYPLAEVYILDGGQDVYDYIIIAQ